jgi:DNA-binding transcriptional regulator YiaG
MPNLSQVIKAEISRISRKEIKSAIGQLRNSTIALKKTSAQLKKRIGALEAQTKRIASLRNALAAQEQSNATTEPDAKVRITSKTIRKLRGKLGLSQDGFAKLLGVSSQAVYIMEHKQGRLNLRTATLTKLLSVRGIGKREAQARLVEVKPKVKKVALRRKKK